MDIDAWLAAAIHDAERRMLPELKPLLEALAQSTRTLRAIDDDRRRRAEPGLPPEPQGA